MGPGKRRQWTRRAAAAQSGVNTAAAFAMACGSGRGAERQAMQGTHVIVAKSADGPLNCSSVGEAQQATGVRLWEAAEGRARQMLSTVLPADTVHVVLMYAWHRPAAARRVTHLDGAGGPAPVLNRPDGAHGGVAGEGGSMQVHQRLLDHRLVAAHTKEVGASRAMNVYSCCAQRCHCDRCGSAAMCKHTVSMHS